MFRFEDPVGEVALHCDLTVLIREGQCIVLRPIDGEMLEMVVAASVEIEDDPGYISQVKVEISEPPFKEDPDDQS